MSLNLSTRLQPPGLQVLMSGNPVVRGGCLPRVGTSGVRGLLSLAITTSGKLPRESLMAGGNAYRVTGEELQWLLSNGYVLDKGNKLEITDAGNELVRVIVELVNLKGKGAES